MLGTIDASQKDVHVLGGGVAGLLAAYRLDVCGFRVHLYEASSRLGGLLATEQCESGIAEAAANSFLASPPVFDLCDRLAVPLVGLNPGARKKFVWRADKLRSFPLGKREALRAFARSCIRKAQLDDPTMSEWALQHLGTPALDYLINPMVTGIYASHPENISVAAAFPRLALEKGSRLFPSILTKRSRVKTVMVAPKYGMESLVQALGKYLEDKIGRRLHMETPVTELPKTGNVVAAVPAPQLAKLVAGAPSLSKVTYVPMVTATVFYPRSAVTSIPLGVGVLFPAVERRRLLGVLFSSYSFKGRVTSSDLASFTVLLGGERNPGFVDLKDSQIQSLVEEEFSHCFKVEVPPTEICIRRWPQGIPQYSSALRGVWKELENGWCREPGHVVLGNYAGQVSLRGMIEDLHYLPVCSVK